MKLSDNIGISSAGKSSGGWVHQDLPFSGSLVAEPVISEAELLELRIAQGRIQDHGARRFRVDGKKGVHASILL
jgi:hypothetical protein